MKARTTRRDWYALNVSLLVWALMLAAALSLVAIYGSNVPSWDDWDMVPTMTGHQHPTLSWLWSQHNEHRVPVPRLLYLALMRFIATDFRTGMYFDTIATAGLALGMIFTIRRIRGHSSYLDAFFPLVLLNWGQAANLLWCWEVQFYASMLLAGTVLILFVRTATPPTLSLSVTTGCCILLLPTCGANGLALVPALTVWLGYAAYLYWRTRTAAGRRNAIIVAAFTAGTMLLVILYLIGYRRVPYHPSTHNPLGVVRTAAQFLTMGYGPGIVGLSFEGRTPMPFWGIVCAAAGGFFVFTAWILLKAWRDQPAERARAAGLFLFLGAMGSIALAVGMGRDGFETRYVTLSVPALCAAYFAWDLYGGPRLKQLMPTILFAGALAVLIPDTWWGLRYARDLKAHLAAFEADMRMGMPSYQLIARHSSYLHPHHVILMDYMQMLRRAGVGSFRQLVDNPAFREIHLPLFPLQSHNVIWKDDSIRVTGPNAWINFGLQEEVPAAGIRLRYSCSNAHAIEPYIGVYWRSGSEPEFTQSRFNKYSPTGDRANWPRGSWSRLNNISTVLEFWIDQPVDSVRLWVLSPEGVVKLHDLSLLVPSPE